MIPTSNHIEAVRFAIAIMTGKRTMPDSIIRDLAEARLVEVVAYLIDRHDNGPHDEKQLDWLNRHAAQIKKLMREDKERENGNGK